VSKKKFSLENALNDIEMSSKKETKKTTTKHKDDDRLKGVKISSPKKQKSGYMTSLFITEEMENIYFNLRVLFRKHFKVSLTKQDAFELGLFLLENNILDKIENVKNNYSGEDNLIELFKNEL